VASNTISARFNIVSHVLSWKYRAALFSRFNFLHSGAVFFQNRRTRTTNTRCLMTITGNVTRSLRSRSRQLEKTSCDRLKEYLSWPFVNVATVIRYLNFSLFLYNLLCSINIC